MVTRYSELYHQGIKGQRWGIRRYQNEDGSLTPAGKDRYARKDRSRALRNRRSLSDQELNDRIKRIKLEREFKRVSEDDIRPGKKFCSNFLNKYGSTVLTSVATSATMYAIYAALTRNVNAEDAAKFIAKPPKGVKIKEKAEDAAKDAAQNAVAIITKKKK